MAQLLKVKDTLKVEKKYPGLLDCVFEHKIASTAGSLTYTGPYIPAKVWHEVLSFFRWTNDNHQSESQVRLYVNTKLNTWAAWAYPQEARTGMSARELDTDDTKKQRAAFPDSEGWLYFGTVHHHCSGAAFQSGTDETNESNQDGLHITVGNLNMNRHDIHCRFYLNGSKWGPDMSEFWNIGDPARSLVPPAVWDQVARWQMCDCVEVNFPDKWKENLIEVRTHQSPASAMSHWPGQEHGTWHGSGGSGGVTQDHSVYQLPRWRRCQIAANAVFEAVKDDKTLRSMDDLSTLLEIFWDGKVIDEIVEQAGAWKVDVEDILKEFDWDSTLTPGTHQVTAPVQQPISLEDKKPDPEPPKEEGKVKPKKGDKRIDKDDIYPYGSGD